MLLRASMASSRLLSFPSRDASSGRAGDTLGPPAVPRGFTASSRGQAPFGVFCCLRMSRELAKFIPPPGVRSFPALTSEAGTMTSADFCRFSRASRPGLPSTQVLSAGHIRQTSPGKSDNFPPTPAAFTAIPLGSIGLCLVLQARPNMTASPAVRGPRVGILPRASFGFHVAVDTLAVG